MAEDTGKLTRKRSYSRPCTRKSVYLWEFLFGMLEDDECTSVISWTNKREGIFTLKNPSELANIWGTVKNKPNMDKYKLFRAMRNYYNRGILKKVKRHKGGYQFLSIPYETEGCDVKMGTLCKTCTKPPLFGSTEHSLTDPFAIITDCNENQTDNHEKTVDNRGSIVDYRKTTENNCERTMQESFDKSVNGCRSRVTSASGYSTSSNDSIKSLEELLADLANTDDITDPMNVTKNKDFVFHDENIIASIEDVALLN